MGDLILKKGQGWRLGWNTEEIAYPGLIGGDDWEIESYKKQIRYYEDGLDKLGLELCL